MQTSEICYHYYNIVCYHFIYTKRGDSKTNVIYICCVAKTFNEIVKFRKIIKSLKVDVHIIIGIFILKIDRKCR